MDKGILNDDIPFDGREVNFIIFVLLVGVVDGTDWCVVHQVGFVDEGGCLHASAYLYDFGY